MAFEGCGFTGPLTLGRSVKRIEPGTFYDCSSLSGPLVIPDGLKWIGDEAFYCCTGLSGVVVIPESVEILGDNVFTWCVNLRVVDTRRDTMKDESEQNNEGCDTT